MVERIDAYSHVTTAELTERLQEINPSLDKPKPSLLFLDEVDTRLEYLDEYGIDEQVITMAEQRIWTGQEPEDVIDVARFANDEVRRYADEHPDRFVPVGTLPYLTGEYVDEFERCVHDLDMAGIQIFSNVDGRHLDDEEFYRFYEAVDEADVPVWIHPQDGDWDDVEAEDYWLYTMFGWPFETTIEVARLVFNGVLDEFRNLKIVSHHLGGFIPFAEERMHSWADKRRNAPPGRYSGTESMRALSEPVDAYFERIYADTAVSSRGRTSALRCGYDFFGEDNLLFAADVPYSEGDGFEWMDETIPAIEEMDVPESAKRKIFSENAGKLLS